MLHDAAKSILSHYAVGEAKLTEVGHLINGGGNVKFCVEFRAKHEKYLLSLHYSYSGPLDGDKFKSTLMWLDAIHRDTSMVVQVPVPNRMDQLVTEFWIGSTQCMCFLLHWIEGRNLWTTGEMVGRSQADARRMGATMAQLHQHSSEWEPPEGFVRPLYSRDDMNLALADLREADENREISTEDFTALTEAAERIDQCVTAMGKTQQTWGLIHGDAHAGNFIICRKKLGLIDMTGHFGYYFDDIAYSFIYMDPKFRKSFLDGYNSIRTLPPDYQRTVEAFLIKLRLVMWRRWVGLRGGKNKPFYNQFREGIAFIARQCRSYLKHEPFLCKDNRVEWFNDRLSL